MAQTQHKTETTFDFGVEMVSRGRGKQKKADAQVDFVPMLCVDIKTGTILVDKREDKYWTL